MNKKRLILGVIIIAAFGVFGLTAFQHALTPYVTFVEAAAKGGTAQVSGTVDKATARHDAARGVFTFELTDRSGTTMVVEYSGAPPANFDDAESVVAVGSIDGSSNVFRAKKLLVKCPSKYQAG